MLFASSRENPKSLRRKLALGVFSKETAIEMTIKALHDGQSVFFIPSITSRAFSTLLSYTRPSISIFVALKFNIYKTQSQIVVVSTIMAYTTNFLLFSKYLVYHLVISPLPCSCSTDTKCSKLVQKECPKSSKYLHNVRIKSNPPNLFEISKEHRYQILTSSTKPSF